MSLSADTICVLSQRIIHSLEPRLLADAEGSTEMSLLLHFPRLWRGQNLPEQNQRSPMGLLGAYHRQLVAETTHALVWRNDPTLTHVVVGQDTWAVLGGDQSQLGDALLQNTAVTAISLELSEMWHLLKQIKGKGIGDIPSVSSLIVYLSTSETLNKVSLSSRTGHGRDCHMMQGLCGSVLFALTGNTNLMHLEVQAPFAPYALVHFLTNAPPCLQIFTLDLLHSRFSELRKEDQFEIGQSLSSAQGITRLELTEISDFGLAKDIIRHLSAQDHGTVKKLLLADCKCCHRETYEQIEEMQADLHQLGCELSAIRSLQCLELVDAFVFHKLHIVLNEVTAHASLKEIVLRHEYHWNGGVNSPATDTFPRALCRLLQSRATSIEHVSLHKFKFNQTTWTMLKHALQNKRMKRLSLVQCRFDKSATAALVTSLRDPTMDTNGEMVQELVLELFDAHGQFEAQTTVSVMAAMLGTTNKMQHKLCIRGLQWYYLFAALDSIHRHADIQSPVLHLDFLKTADCHALGLLLPSCTKLVEFVVERVEPLKDSRILMHGFHRNASLVHVDMKGSDGVSPLLNASDLRKLKAYCLRNKLVPILLTTFKTSVHLLPLLFAAVQQSPKHATNSILKGLLHSSSRDFGLVYGGSKRQYP
jgi:hypothetical protein